jgi:uncharacterized protein (TIGR02594 family)
MTEPTPRIVNASGLRLREGPSLTAKVTGSVPRGSVITVTEEQGSWSHVQALRRDGWVASKYLISVDHALAPGLGEEEFPWMPIALSEKGVVETPDDGNTARVLEYLRSTELDAESASDDSTPWCSGFVNWCVEKSGHVGTNSAAARSWLHWGKEIQRPRRGCIAVFDRGNGGGHVAFYVSKGRTGAGIDVLGGNQGNAVRVDCYGAHLLLGYRVPG